MFYNERLTNSFGKRTISGGHFYFFKQANQSGPWHLCRFAYKSRIRRLLEGRGGFVVGEVTRFVRRPAIYTLLGLAFVEYDRKTCVFFFLTSSHAPQRVVISNRYFIVKYECKEQRSYENACR